MKDILELISHNTLLVLALLMGMGMLFGRLIRYIKLPNVTAYLLAGLVCGPFCLGLVTKDTTASFSLISDVALGFIAYSIGGEFKLSYIREIGIKPIIITIFEASLASACVFCALWLLGVPMPMTLALAAIAAATAPAATLMVVRQYKANGPVTRMLMPVVAMDDAAGLMLYAILMSIANAIHSGVQPTVMTLAIEPLLEIIGSLVLGVVFGLLLVYVLRFFHSRGNKLSLTILFVFLATGLSGLLGLSSLLVCMMLGATMVNLCKQSDTMLEQCDRFTPPLFMLFFILSGAGLDLSVLPTVGVAGIAYVLSRSLGKYTGATIGSVVEKCETTITKYLGFTLLPQAGVAIGLARLAMHDLPDYGAQINAIILAGTLIYELTGPVITKIALTKAGEIKAEAAGAKANA